MTKMRKPSFIFLLLCITAFFNNCGRKEKIKIDAAEVMHQNQDQLTKLIIYDVFTPPVASRIYSYTSLAQYEAIRFSDPVSNPSIVAQLNGFNQLPQPDAGKKYDFSLAATEAFFTVARKVTFSVDSFIPYENKIYGAFRNNLDDSVYMRSVAFGKQISQTILMRAANDNYPQTRGKPKFLGSNDPGKWRPTPPDYFDGVEYCWGTMKTFVLDSSSQFAPPLPPEYSEDTGSTFFKATQQVYDINKNLTPEQIQIARYWDDNPFVMEHSGHLMFANKKITPGGHWMGITEIACRKSKAGPVKTAKAYALTAIAMFDSFICCWEEKYRSAVIRPVSVINQQIDANWVPYLQTPPFPEYPSGHSAITRAAATVLTDLFGDDFSFLDTSDLEYIGMQREFNSFLQAANEASISRVYGGIHYVYSVNAGAEQGRKVAEYILHKLKL
jgi:hypothetical protein